MDATTLFREGTSAFKRGDHDEARRLLTRSVQLDPRNATAWLWLSRVQTDPRRQRQCVERALVIDPDNAAARQIQARLAGQADGSGTVRNGSSAPAAPADPFTGVTPVALPGRKPPPPPPSPADERRIHALLEKAELHKANDRDEDALECWVSVLTIQVDHEYAMKHSVKTLVKLGYFDDAEELVTRAIEAGTRSIPIHLTAIDLGKRSHSHQRVNELRRALVRLPGVEPVVIARVIDDLLALDDTETALAICKGALAQHPQDQGLLVCMGDIQKRLGRPREAVGFYNQAAALGTRNEAGREADKRLEDYAPVLTDRERGSVALAWREASGFGVFFFLLAWQDVGLNLAHMTPDRWLGVLLGVIGGYLLVTATSSPQQRGLAKLLGGQVPPPPYQGATLIDRTAGAVEEVSRLPRIALPLRVALGVTGTLILFVGAWLVFSTAIDLLFFNPVPPDLSQLDMLLY